MLTELGSIASMRLASHSGSVQAKDADGIVNFVVHNHTMTKLWLDYAHEVANAAATER